MKFYQTTWFIILMLVCFAPLGIFLMWKYKSNWSKAVKWILSVVFISCYIALPFSH